MPENRGREHTKLETLARCPCLAGSFIGGEQHDRPTGLARIAPPEDAQPVARRPHLSALDAVHISGKVRSGQPVPFNCSRSAVPKAG